MIILQQEITKEGAYELKKIKKGDIIPLVSNTMFETMLNNTKRKKYVAYLLSLILEENFKDVLNGLEFVKESMDKENYYDSKKTVDLICKFKDKYYNIEMNNNNTEKERLERNISYLTKIYDGSMKIGNKKYIYNNCVQININNFNFRGNTKEIDKFYIQNDNLDKLTDKITFVYIYLPLIRKKYYNKGELTKLEKLMMIFNEEKTETVESLMKEEIVMEEYRRDATEASKEETIIGLYDKELEDKMLQEAVNDRLLQEGKEEGIKEGKIQGIKEGKVEGIKEGKIEGILSVAKEMLKRKVSISDISLYTGLSKKEIENISYNL